MRYRIGVDVGGTFTDLLLVGDDGRLVREKTLSTPPDYHTGILSGLHRLARAEGYELPGLLAEVDLLVHGTTVATNTVLTGSGARTALLTTRGFRDALAMRRGVKEKIYDNKDAPPPTLVARNHRLPITERVSYDGTMIEELVTSDVEHAARLLAREGFEAVAICFLNAYANGANEALAAKAIQGRLDDVFVTVSHELLPRIGFYDRLSTTVLNAYTGPALRSYLQSLRDSLADRGFRGAFLVMLSSGGVAGVEVASQIPVSAVRSGPAGCTIAAAFHASNRAQGNAVSFDMGGTSLDVASIIDGTVRTVQSADFNRYRVAVPMVDLVSIGAGGGSIAWLDAGGLLHVGPETAGADPGPACYGQGGTKPTVTDADLLLGYIDPAARFGGDVAVDSAAAAEAVKRDIAVPLRIDVTQAAKAIYEVVNVNMATAVREYLHERGRDPRDFTLIVAGGAGPLHAVPIAEELGIRMVMVPFDAPILSAVGLLLADLRHDLVQTHFAPLADLDFDALLDVYRDLEATGQALLESEGINSAEQIIEYAADLRYDRQINELEVEITAEQLENADRSSIAQSFHDRHEAAYGYAVPESPIEFVNAKLSAIGTTPSFEFPEREPPSLVEPPKKRHVLLPGEHSAVELDIVAGDNLGHQSRLQGPVIVEGEMTSVLVPEGWLLEVDAAGNYILEPRL